MDDDNDEGRRDLFVYVRVFASLDPAVVFVVRGLAEARPENRLMDPEVCYERRYRRKRKEWNCLLWKDGQNTISWGCWCEPRPARVRMDHSTESSLLNVRSRARVYVLVHLRTSMSAILIQ